MMKNNIKDYDNLTIYVKRGKLDEIVSRYNLFGWTLAKELENDRYEDIVDLTFTRPHKIKDKDELQLLQVYMEEKMNKLGKAEKFKHSFSTILALCLGVLGLALMVLGGLSCLNLISLFGLIGGAIAVSLGGLFIILTSIFIPKLVKKENVKFYHIRKELENQINEICKRTSSLTGEKNEQE